MKLSQDCNFGPIIVLSDCDGLSELMSDEEDSEVVFDDGSEEDQKASANGDSSSDQEENEEVQSEGKDKTHNVDKTKGGVNSNDGQDTGKDGNSNKLKLLKRKMLPSLPVENNGDSSDESHDEEAVQRKRKSTSRTRVVSSDG